MTSEKTSATNPWNGLRPYQEGETIYGRSEEISILTLLITQNRQTVIYGKSGIGKSSILNAGIFPIVRKKNIFPICVRFEHDSNVPYLEQIKIRVNEEIKKAEGKIILKEIYNATPQEDLWEFLHRTEFLNDKNEAVAPLIVFDQFEEIFTLENDYKKVNNFFRQLADTINDIIPEHLLSQDFPKNSPKSEESETGILDLGLDTLDTQTYAYKRNSNFHLIFTLREDFLSYFERNTTDIPSLRNNRYCLQPINAKQAAEIITNPRPGLVDSDVATEIIKKVTGEQDFEINSMPIQVDAAILSLYLNQLYNKMAQCGDLIISRQLVEEYGSNIIEDFYDTAISELSDKCIDWIENTLVNEEGRRDNRDRSTVIKETGLSEKQLNHLINETKLLHQFSYGKSLRIEYIHDILCPIVIKNREYRLQRKITDEEARKLKRRAETLRTALIICFLIFLSAALYLAYITNSKMYKYTMLLLEDSSINITDYWKARVTILSGMDTICVMDVDKSNPMFTFDVRDTKSKNLQYNVDFLIGDFITGQVSDDVKYNSHEISIPISYSTNRTLIKGVVVSRIGTRAPIYDAMVIVNDQLAKTNYRGEFALYADSILQDSTIRIIKKGYKLYDGKLTNGTYRLSMNGDYNFFKLAQSMQTKIRKSPNAKTLKGAVYSFEKGGTVSGKAHMIIALSNDSIFGYTYYDKIYKREHNKVNSYFLINGKINLSNNTFKLHFMDAVYNEIEYTGRIKENSQWYGETFDKSKKLGYFIFE